MPRCGCHSRRATTAGGRSPGQMAVFPASLTHEIALVRSPGPLVLVTVRVRFVAPGQQGVATLVKPDP